MTAAAEAVALVARRSFKYAGQEIARGETFTVDPARATQLERTGYATVAPEGEAAFGARALLEKTERGRASEIPERTARRAATMPKAPEPEPAPLSLTAELHPDDNSLRAILLRRSEARISALEATVARLTAALAAQQAEPAPKARPSLTKKVTDA